MRCNGGCGVGLVLSPKSCSNVPEMACVVQRTSQEQRHVLPVRGRAAPPGNAWRGLRRQVHSALGTNPAWESRNLLRLKQEQPQHDSANLWSLSACPLLNPYTTLASIWGREAADEERQTVCLSTAEAWGG